jgi:hypothetical protein
MNPYQDLWEVVDTSNIYTRLHFGVVGVNFKSRITQSIGSSFERHKAQKLIRQIEFLHLGRTWDIQALRFEGQN